MAKKADYLTILQEAKAKVAEAPAGGITVNTPVEPAPKENKQTPTPKYVGPYSTDQLLTVGPSKVTRAQHHELERSARQDATLAAMPASQRANGGRIAVMNNKWRENLKAAPVGWDRNYTVVDWLESVVTSFLYECIEFRKAQITK